MRYKVEITEEPRYDVMIEDLPQAKTGMQVNYSLYNKLAAIGGADMRMSDPDPKATKTITKVPREAANLEAEGGETVLTFDPSGFPLFYIIKGPRHHSGGVPLNLPDDSFIFSDTKQMIIRDCTILKMFNKACNKKGFTPAVLSKQFDINRYRNILQDPNSDEITRKTAESMIKKYVIKLGALALAQEAKKGFPQGVPVVAKAYMEAYGISEGDIIPEKAEPMQQVQGQMSPTDQMPPDQYAQEPMPDGMQNAEPAQMMEDQMMAQQQGQAPQGMATPEMVEPMMNQMAQQQGPPMAMYGMTMGGYDMPFYPQMAYGGFPRFAEGGLPAEGGKIVEKSSSNVITDPQTLKKEFIATGEKITPEVEGRTYIDIGNNGVQGWGQETSNERQLEYKRGTGTYRGTDDQYIQDICKRMKSGDLKGVSAKQAIDKLRVIYPGHSRRAEWELILQGCESIDKTIETQFIKKEGTEECPPCTDPTTGEAITTGPDGQPFTRTKDENGNCTPCPTSECYCEDEMGNEKVVDCNDPCLQRKEQNYYGESNYNEVPVQNLPEDQLALMATLGFRDAEARPQYIGPRGVQTERYGIDPRSKANQYTAASNKIQDAQSKFVNNPGAALGNSLEAQARTADLITSAYDEANKFNTAARNEEIGINTEYRRDFLDKLPVYAGKYNDEVAAYKENKARFANEKAAAYVKEYRNMADNARNMALLNASNENVKFDPSQNKFYTIKTKDFTPTPQGSDLLSKTKQVMAEGIEDENVAFKLAQQMVRRGGPIYVNGGFVYTDNIFPFLI